MLKSNAQHECDSHSEITLTLVLTLHSSTQQCHAAGLLQGCPWGAVGLQGHDCCAYQKWWKLLAQLVQCVCVCVCEKSLT